MAMYGHQRPLGGVIIKRGQVTFMVYALFTRCSDGKPLVGAISGLRRRLAMSFPTLPLPRETYLSDATVHFVRVRLHESTTVLFTALPVKASEHQHNDDWSDCNSS